MYQTKDQKWINKVIHNGYSPEFYQRLSRGSGFVVGEFVCDYVNEFKAELFDSQTFEAIYDASDCVLSCSDDSDWEYNSFLQETCLRLSDLRKYLGKGFHYFYGLHISNVVRYDEPIGISSFNKLCSDKYGYCPWCPHGLVTMDEGNEIACLLGQSYDTEWHCLNFVKKAPQSWCYVQDLEEME